MRKIDLSPATIKVLDENGKPVVIPYDIKSSIEAVMLATGPATQQRLSMVELLRNARTAQKITMSKDGFVLLEDNEYQIVKKSFNAFRGFGRNDVEMCRRIMNAEAVEVEEKKKKKA